MQLVYETPISKTATALEYPSPKEVALWEHALSGTSGSARTVRPTLASPSKRRGQRSPPTQRRWTELVAVEEAAGISAKTVIGRPGLLRALGRLDAGKADGLLAVKLDRLTRSVRDLGDLVERYFSRRWSVLSLGDPVDTRTASDRLV